MITSHFRVALRRLVRADVPAPDTTDVEFNAEVERNYRWNFTFNLLDVASFWIGMSFMSSATIVPLYVSKLTPSALAIGLVAVIANAGWFLPQLFTANSVQGWRARSQWWSIWGSSPSGCRSGCCRFRRCWLPSRRRWR